jgi:hypothetical protein
MSRVCFALLLAGVLTAGGCGDSKTYAGPNGEKVTVNKDGGSVEINATGKNGEKVQFSANGLALPEDFPKDVPVYPDAKVLSSVKAKEGTMITLQTPVEAEKVEEFYAKELKDKGWTTETTVALPQGKTFVNKIGKRTLSVSVNKGDNTMIMMVVGEEK